MPINNMTDSIQEIIVSTEKTLATERRDMFDEMLTDTNIPAEYFPIIRQMLRTAYTEGQFHKEKRQEAVRLARETTIKAT